MRMADCHPDRKHKSNGLCNACNASARRRNRKARDPEYRRKIQKREKARLRQRAAEDPAFAEKVRLRTRNYMLRYTYGLTLDDYDRLFTEQGGQCAICLRPPVPGRILMVDHSHATGTVRGLLCSPCNMYLGFVERDPELLGRLQDHLGKNATIP